MIVKPQCNIVTLLLKNSRISTEMFQQIGAMTHLSELNLSGCGMTDKVHRLSVVSLIVLGSRTRATEQTSIPQVAFPPKMRANHRYRNLQSSFMLS